ncbi:hypothetical protein [Aliiroseovarius crassostreae]|uniref:hypothetical protein n=1 Tax=Aliiroseovarius crassostreae TaxID=154981 RepID=UPI002206BF3E|nr:hypothetical protein [Aliiroseovarius crassostreae]UWP88794.1 hypothetical protein K3J57_13105 [Aliiroseovarius crassostreae]
MEVNEAFTKNGWMIIKTLGALDSAYLSEDLAQFRKGSTTVDFGFYGDGTHSDQGEFIIFAIKYEDWEHPIIEFHSNAFSVCLDELCLYAKQLGS